LKPKAARLHTSGLSSNDGGAYMSSPRTALLMRRRVAVMLMMGTT